MKQIRYCFAFFILLTGMWIRPAQAQGETTGDTYRSAKKAFGLSLLLPGLGHRYANHGNWQGMASFFAVADAGIWLSLIGTEWRRDELVQNYQTLASSRAGAIIEGKDRTFFLNLASYQSSDEYLEINLRDRAWDQIDYVADRTFQWKWETEEDHARFRSLREDAESLRRRRPLLLALLAGNRLLAGLTAIRSANRANNELSPTAISLGIPPEGGKIPLVRLSVIF